MRTARFLLAFLVLAIPASTFAQVRVAISFGPPALPIYEQPICPGDGYIWTPGFWAYDDNIADYYWVPGTWVLAPEAGFLWTPPYWGWGSGGFLWNEGYWGPTVGFYGGINYGFGYFGHGYGGGRWDNGHFFYNRSVSNVDITMIHNVYNTTIVNDNVTRVSYNGGTGGIVDHPTPQEQAAAGERHIPPVSSQTDQARTARANPNLRASVNHGAPSIAATSKAGDFSEHSVVAAKAAGEPYKGGAGGTVTQPAKVVHPKELPPITHPAPVNSGNPKADQKFQQQQDKLIAKQEQERQDLQQKQDAEHQKTLNDAQTQKLEQKHQQQTQQLVEKHTQEQQTLQARAPQSKPHK
jgi:YXWGXW repeat-containing protein